MSEGGNSKRGPAGTVFVPQKKGSPRKSAPPSAPAAAPSAEATPPGEPRKAPRSRAAPAKPAPRIGGISVGSTLNGIYEVRRFIARGGMAEVYEGVYIGGDERVAIKVILKHLAGDERVQAAFMKEARILTQLAHPALVQYRMRLFEPTLGVFYIVTEFIDGDPLSDLLGQVVPSPAELRAVTRRLAMGLGAAHELGVFHRDMAPDNVLLPHGRLERAKIIDFGIAKDIDPSKETIIGDGFAGKLAYVAPEQFGEYGGAIGAYTDVYSLALVILALASGKESPMGGSPAEAMAKRRTIPDLSALPEALRPIFRCMLEPDPSLRLQTMEDVISALDGMVLPGPADEPPRKDTSKRDKAEKRVTDRAHPPEPPKFHDSVPPISRPRVAPPPVAASGPIERLIANSPLKSHPRPLLYAGGAGLAVILVVMSLVLVMTLLSPTDPNGPAAEEQAAVAAGPPPAENIRRAVEAALPGLACSWIDIKDVSAGEVSVQGAAEGGGTAMNAALADVLARAGISGVNVVTDDVLPLQPEACPLVDAVRVLRVERPNSERAIQSVQPRYEIGWGVCPGLEREGGRPLAKPVVNFEASGDFVILGIGENGQLDLLFDRQWALTTGVENKIIAQRGSYGLQFSACTSKKLVQGLVLLQGDNLGQLSELGLRNKGHRARQTSSHEAAVLLKALGERNHWQAAVAWYETVDQRPNVK